MVRQPTPSLGSENGKRKLPAPAEKSQVGSLLYATASNGLLALFTFLVGHGARSFAGRLTRSLAFAATAVFSALAKVSCLKCCYSFHDMYLRFFCRYNFL